MILKDAFRMLGTSPRIEFLVHGTPEHRHAWAEVGEKCALFCDIAPHKEAMETMRSEFYRRGDVVVLDHHKGTEEIVRQFGELGVFADEKAEPGVSGAVLAFREVWDRVTTPGQFVRHNVQDFAECVGARDTWQTNDPRFQRGQWMSKALMSKPASYWLNEHNPARALLGQPQKPYLDGVDIQMGQALFEAHENAVREAVEQCAIFGVNGEDRYVRDGVEHVAEGVTLYVFQEQASGFRLTSDVAESIRRRIGDERGVVAGFSFVLDKGAEEPMFNVSLRGLGGFDVAAFARANGGNGHTAAAGFRVTLPQFRHNPYQFLCDRLFAHLKDLASK